MTIRLPASVRNQRAAVLNTLLGNSAVLRIYGGTIPATADTAVTDQPLLAEFTLPSDGFGSQVDGVLTASGMALMAFSAIATGTATWFRLSTAAPAYVGRMDGTVSVTGGGGDLQLDNVSIAQGRSVTITSFVWSVANV